MRDDKAIPDGLDVVGYIEGKGFGVKACPELMEGGRTLCRQLQPLQFLSKFKTELVCLILG